MVLLIPRSLHTGPHSKIPLETAPKHFEDGNQAVELPEVEMTRGWLAKVFEPTERALDFPAMALVYSSYGSMGRAGSDPVRRDRSACLKDIARGGIKSAA